MSKGLAARLLALEREAEKNDDLARRVAAALAAGGPTAARITELLALARQRRDVALARRGVR